MRILYPKPLSVIASEAAETETIPEWAAGEYAQSDKVIRSVAVENAAIDVSAIDYVFEAGVGTSADPASGSLDWINRGASEAYKVFDESITTRSPYASGSILEIRALKLDGVFLSRFNGSALLEAFDASGDMPFFSRLVTASSNLYEPAASWTTYFFRDLISTGAAQDILVEIPARVSGVRIRLTAQTGGFSLGKIIAGVSMEIGKTMIPPTVGINDYSIKAVDENGNIYIKEKAFSKVISFEVWIATARFDQIASLLALLRAKPTVYIGDDLARFSSLSVYGTYRNFSMLLSGEDISDCTLEIEGIT
ncbi:MAG: hypothetical protein LBT81_00725 [Helicobacteraceae bacterium]|jgi:hypothetical protein|nr:hypothetical protein [Helicobacteraceae bacterium]